MSTLEWLNSYVGIPYMQGGRDRRGVDCYGLLYLIYFERDGTVLPDWETDSINLKDRAKAIGSVVCSGDWAHKQTPDDGDIVVCSRKEASYHIGLFYGGYVIHAVSGQGVICEPLSRFKEQCSGVKFGRWTP